MTPIPHLLDEMFRKKSLVHLNRSAIEDLISTAILVHEPKVRRATAKEIPDGASTAGEWTMERSGLWRFVVDGKCLASVSTNISRWFTFSPNGDAGESGENFETAKQEAVASLVRQGWYSRPSPAVDVMARIRELESALKRTAMKQDADAREFAASECKRLGIGGTVALVAPRTAEESSGVDDVANRLMGFRLVPDASIPPGEIHANVDGYTAGKIVGMDAPTKPEAREGEGR